MVPAPDSPPKRRRREQPASPPLRQRERDFQESVLKLAKAGGWGTYHTWASLNSTGGFPDLVMVKRPRVVFAELKRQDRDPTPEQTAWLEELRACGQEAYLWRPSDWDEIERVLTGRSEWR
jgi:hypothetical protein